jgi:hypothetical protein
VTKWKRKCHPHWGTEDECKEEKHCPPRSPVQVTLPEFLVSKQKKTCHEENSLLTPKEKIMAIGGTLKQLKPTTPFDYVNMLKVYSMHRSFIKYQHIKE